MAYILWSSLPDNLVNEVVRVLGSKHSKSGPCRHALLKANHLRVDREDRRLINILNRDGDSCCGLKWRLDAAGKVGLVGHYHRQHEGAVHLKVHRLRRKWRRGDRREREIEKIKWWETGRQLVQLIARLVLTVLQFEKRHIIQLKQCETKVLSQQHLALQSRWKTHEMRRWIVIKGKRTVFTFKELIIRQQRVASMYGFIFLPWPRSACPRWWWGWCGWWSVQRGLRWQCGTQHSSWGCGVGPCPPPSSWSPPRSPCSLAPPQKTTGGRERRESKWERGVRRGDSEEDVGEITLCWCLFQHLVNAR